MPRDHNPQPRDCGHCDGTGWVWVAEAYALHAHPVPTAEQAAARGADLAVLTAKASASRAAVLASVYPCKHCNTALFYRWAGGHLDTGHDRGRCGECIDVTGRGTRRRRAAPAEPEPVGADRKDLF